MDNAASTPTPKDKEKKKKKTSSKKVKDAPVEDAVPNEEQRDSIAEAEPQEEPQDEHVDEDPSPDSSSTKPAEGYKSAALEVIEEILNPSIKIPQSEGPYTVPEAVQAGDVEALKDLDERKIIELKEVFTLFDADADGFISESDLRSTFSALGKDASHDTIEQMLSEAMNPLDFDAFVVLMGYKTIELDPEDVLLEAWSKWDKDGSGTIEEDKCVDQIHIFPHLREPVIQDSIKPEETVCSENVYNFLPPRAYNNRTLTKLAANSTTEEAIEDENLAPPISRKHFRIRQRQSVFSSDRILGMRLTYEPFHTGEAFRILGRFQFIDKAMFKNEGNIVPTTYCDYLFLPRAINYAELQETESAWRYFHTPRYPAKYPGHIKCTYKFTGRPRNRVEVLFEEIYLLTGHSSCLQHPDKITIYDGKTPDKSSTIDVFCNEVPSRRVISSGPNLLIEFEASSNRTSNGFSAKYRFLDIMKTENYKAPSAENLTNELLAISTTAYAVLPSVTVGATTVQEKLSTKSPPKQTDDGHRINNGSNETIANSSQQEPLSSRGDGGRSSQLCPPGFIARTNGPTTTSAAVPPPPAPPPSPGKGSDPVSQYRGSNCDKVVYSTKSKNGTIQTPLFPGAYPVRTFCRYEFQGQGRERIQIKFFEFTLPSEGDSYDCEDADTLSVFVPIRGRFEPIETLCGDTMPKPIMSNGPRLLLEFRGKQSGKGSRGFQAEYKFLENFGIISGRQLPDSECSFAFNNTEGRGGWFHSPNFPGAYPRNLECNYYFYGQANDRIFIRFTYFDVEGIFPCEEATASDYVEFSNFMSIDRKFRKLCGKRDGFTVRSDGRFFRITFRTNDRFDKTGFRASYSFEAEPPTTEATFAQESSGGKRKSSVALIAAGITIYFYRAARGFL